jgi:nicotinamidase-related amidase
MIHGRAALLVIDVQHDFIDEGAPVHCVGGLEMLPKTKALIEECRAAQIPVIYTKEVHRPTRIDMGRELDGDEPDHCLLGTTGVEIMEEVAPAPDDIVVTKARYNAFLGTDLEFVLNGFGVRPHDTLIICGDATNVCVHYTAAEAHQRDFRLKVVRDCCAGSSREAHEAALEQIEYLQHGSVVSLAEVTEQIAEHARGAAESFVAS